MNQLLPQLIALIIVLPLIAFWLWMFWEMRKSAYLPDNSAGPLTWPPSTKYTWTLAFIFLNVFAAAFYYAWEYKKRQ
jgi:heme/copper-type cytochrome/quinol oxidase subunit 2